MVTWQTIELVLMTTPNFKLNCNSYHLVKLTKYFLSKHLPLRIIAALAENLNLEEVKNITSSALVGQELRMMIIVISINPLSLIVIFLKEALTRKESE